MGRNYRLISDDVRCDLSLSKNFPGCANLACDYSRLSALRPLAESAAQPVFRYSDDETSTKPDINILLIESEIGELPFPALIW